MSIAEELVQVVEDVSTVVELVAPWAWIDVKAQAATIKEGLKLMERK